MKKITIGNKEYKLMESAFDIGDQRFVVFKQYILQVFENIDKPLFLQTYAKCMAFHNKNQHADVVIELNDFKRAMDLKELNYDAYSFCFCLLVLTDGEDMNDTTELTQVETKLKMFREDGLTRGMVVDVVENFMKASPKEFGVYLQMLELMKAPLSEEHLNELSDLKAS
jgi:hypothetical protein